MRETDRQVADESRRDSEHETEGNGGKGIA